jgi:hypothetical protein
MVTVTCVAAVTRDLRLPPAGARRLSLLTGRAELLRIIGLCLAAASVGLIAAG